MNQLERLHQLERLRQFQVSDDGSLLLPTPGERVDAAIDFLAPSQIAALRARFPGDMSVRALVVQACAMPMPSILSDIIAGRMPGNKYRAVLANLLSIDLGWLNGTGGPAPDWALSPSEAWRRFEDRLRNYGDVHDEDESSHPLSPQRMRVSAASLAEVYHLEIQDDFIQALAYGRYADVPFAVALAHAAQIGIPSPTHPEHLRIGHRLWRDVTVELAKELRTARKRFHRYLMPPALFEEVRQALVSAKNPENAEAVADGLELLWRQQWLLLDRSRSTLPPSFQEDVGQERWRKLNTIRERWMPDESYEL